MIECSGDVSWQHSITDIPQKKDRLDGDTLDSSLSYRVLECMPHNAIPDHCGNEVFVYMLSIWRSYYLVIFDAVLSFFLTYVLNKFCLSASILPKMLN